MEYLVAVAARHASDLPSRHCQRARMTLAVVALSALLIIASSSILRADDSEPTDLTLWVRTCLDHLRSPEEKVRDGARAALLMLGTDAIPGMLRVAREAVDPQAYWRGLERLLGQIGADTSAKALERHSVLWPEKQAATIRDVHDRLVRVASGGESRLLGLPPKVADVLMPVEATARWSSSPDTTEVQQLVAMGRAIIPALLDVLRRFQAVEGSYAAKTAAVALGELVRAPFDPEVDPVLERLAISRNPHVYLVSMGRRRRLQGRRVVSSLDEDMCRWPFACEVLLCAPSAELQRAIISWLDRHPQGDPRCLGTLAEYLARQNAYETVPLLRGLLKGHDADGAYWGLVAALVKLGVAETIPLAIEHLVLAQSDEFGEKPWDVLGRLLDQVAQRDVYGGLTVRSEADREDAAEAFRAWWRESGSTLAFDRETHTWTYR